MKNWLENTFYGLRNKSEFIAGIQKAVNNLSFQQGIWTGDNLFTYGRNLSFLEDEAFMLACEKNDVLRGGVEKSLLWRMSTVLWGIRQGLKLEGDFVECACYKGTTARVICDAIDFKLYQDKHYYLYDLFDHDPNLPHHAMPEHSKQLYAWVKNRFNDLENVTVTQGKVPDVLKDVAPEKIAFMHLDLNNADAEVGALEVLFDRMVSGAILVLDDYGWLGYRAQKLAEDPWFAKRGYHVLELPTGQGVIIK